MPEADLLTAPGIVIVLAEPGAGKTELLDSETMEQIEQLLQQKGLRIDSVENPHQKLEQLFLDIVHQAQEEGLSTQGATSGGQIAYFSETPHLDVVGGSVF